MGKVFSWSDLVAGRVPSLSSFKVICSQVEAEITENDEIIGGLLFGSVLWDCHNIRSDLDCLVIYDEASSASLLPRLRQLHSNACDLHVPLALIQFDRRLAGTSLHHIGILFAKHLDCIIKRGGVIKLNPMDFFHFEPGQEREDLNNYLRFKLRYFGNGLVEMPNMSDHQFYGYLSKMLEIAPHIARKVLTVSGCELANDTKTEIVKSYLNQYENQQEELCQLFRTLIELDSWYTTELNLQLLSPNVRQYREVIEKLKAAAADCYEFVRQTALLTVH